MIIDYRNKVGFCSLSSSKCSLISWEAQMKYDIGLDCNVITFIKIWKIDHDAFVYIVKQGHLFSPSLDPYFV
jgi:hypothetical protein